MNRLRLIAAIFITSFIMLKLLKYLLSFRNELSRLYFEVNQVKRFASRLNQDLIPFNGEELSELSYNQSLNKNIKKVKAFTLTTIFQEPLVNTICKYDPKSQSGYLLASTNSKLFTLIKHHKHTDVFIDDAPIARLTHQGQLTDAFLKPFAMTSKVGNQKVVHYNNEEIAKIQLKVDNPKITRALFMKQDLSEEYNDIILIYTLYEMYLQ